MGMTSIWHWIIVLIVVLLLFGAGKIPQLMGDMAKGVKAFKAGMKEGEEEAPAAAPSVTQAATAPAQAAPAVASTPMAHSEAQPKV